jgi:peptidoglycan hydrolase CwlO-like protein
VISLNTQVAVLANSNTELKKTIEGYMERMDRTLDNMSSRDESLDQRMTMMRNDLTKEQGRIDNLMDDVKDLKAEQGLYNRINAIVTAIVTAVVGIISYFLFGNR